MTADAAVDDLAAVAGIVDVLCEMLAEKNAGLAGLAERNQQLSGQVKDLSGQVATLLERVAKLERQVSRNRGTPGCRRRRMTCRDGCAAGPEAEARARDREEARQAARRPRRAPGLVR
ncbi:MAG: hypothetical protein ACRDPY_50255 [Streptosporangiaceae bacterium]